MDKKKIALSIVLIMTLLSAVSFAKPVSSMTFSVGPYLSQDGFNMTASVDLTLDFWVAHVESAFRLSAIASNNTIVLTPESSNVFKYVDFDWGNLRVEYGATNTHSSLFPTVWDVGTIPTGWTWTVGGGSNGNKLWIASDRGTYFVKYKGLLYADALWYGDASDFTIGTSGEIAMFADGGTKGSAYFVGVGGRYGNFTAALRGYSAKAEIFPNVSEQIPSRYVTMIGYKDGNSNVMFAMTENEFYVNGSAVYPLFGGTLGLNMTSSYINEFVPVTDLSVTVEYARKIGTSDLFVNASYDKGFKSWIGLKWSF